ncbi:MBL fold metallo-hydrolase [Petroclostridium sp. X23]|uniref:MBL fold metallo-hydrolase n=1 Tax=Petroclostridium sp. X23 TaxID=3045146 RepID=UPI0024AD88FD|nr:MBL fold metallo-hydrolase [Petroclostridium sp. X23]WHH59067.1 MBL fold metallo-hydrolase [Petroclostridium sp. X23]
MILEVIPVGPIQANCYIVGDKDTNEVAVIDPGEEGNRIVDGLQKKGYKAKYIIATHGHADHIGAVKYLKQHTLAPVMIHGNDSECLIDSKKNLSIYMGVESVQVAADIILEDSMTFTVGRYDFKVLYTPGHSPGGVCVLTNSILFSGDTLFNGSVGRTDLPGGNHQQLIGSIRQKLLALPDDTIVYPGHGAKTTIKKEKESNPFI